MPTTQMLHVKRRNGNGDIRLQPKTVQKKTFYVAQNLTGVAVSPNAETERRECGSVEVAYDVERMGPVSGLLEVKQQYIATTRCSKALSNNADEFRFKTTLFRYVSLLRPQFFFKLSSSCLSTLSTIVFTLKAVIVVVINISSSIV